MMLSSSGSLARWFGANGYRSSFDPRAASRASPAESDLLQLPAHVPMTDWYWTHDATKTGFQARSVVGGVFLKLLYDEAVWKKWRTAPNSAAAQASVPLTEVMR